MLYRDFIGGYYPHFDTSITFTYQFYRIRFCHFSWLASKNVSQNLNLWRWDCFTQSIQHDICTKEKLYLFIKKPFFYLLTFISWTSIFMPLIYRNIKIKHQIISKGTRIQLIIQADKYHTFKPWINHSPNNPDFLLLHPPK